MQNEVKSKQQAYAAILACGLRVIRSSCPSADCCFAVADLLHNIPEYILSAEFGEGDFYFLNIQLPGYVALCEFRNTSTNPTLLALCAELQSLVPSHLKSNLKQ